jgi:hypothetical protein
MIKKHKATEEQIEAIIQTYKIKENVLTLLNRTKARAISILEEGLEKGAKAIIFARGSYTNTILPEYSEDRFSRFSLKLRERIAKEIFENFILSNPQYFTHKPKTAKYTISDEFINDVLFHDDKTNFDHLEILNLLRYIDNSVLFDKIAASLYLPFAKDETIEHVRKKCWKRNKRLIVKKSCQEPKNDFLS